MRFRRKPSSKYNAKKIRTPDGETFDSKKEYKRYLELQRLERAGMISDLQRQVKFVLTPEHRERDTVGSRGGVHKGKIIERERSYYADFVYYENGEKVVEDCKGFRTDVYKLKKALMYDRYGIRIRET